MGAPNSKTSNSRSWSRAILFSLFIYAATKLPPLLLSLLPHLHTTLYRRSETFDGFGFNASSQCEAVINDLLSNATESNKGGSAAATTLMTLLPALLTFAPLPTANIRDLIYTSPWIAFWTTGMLFGLPSSYASSEGAKRVFSFVDIRTRSGFGGGMGNGNRAITEPSVSTEPPMPNEAPAPPTPHEGLHGLVFSVDPDPDKENDEENEEIYPLLRDLHLRRPIVPHDHEANIPRSRRARLHIWCLYLITISVGAFQTMLFTAMLVGFPLINNMSVIWLCPSVLPEIYSGWLVGSYVLSSLVMMYWNSSFSRPQMLFHLTPDYVYPRRKPIKGRSFREFIKDPFRAREFDKSCSVEHVAGGGGDLTADAKWAEIKRLNITRYKDLEPGIGDFLAYVVKLIAPLRIRK